MSTVNHCEHMHTSWSVKNLPLSCHVAQCYFQVSLVVDDNDDKGQKCACDIAGQSFLLLFSCFLHFGEKQLLNIDAQKVFLKTVSLCPFPSASLPHLNWHKISWTNCFSVVCSLKKISLKIFTFCFIQLKGFVFFLYLLCVLDILNIALVETQKCEIHMHPPV